MGKTLALVLLLVACRPAQVDCRWCEPSTVTRLDPYQPHYPKPLCRSAGAPCDELSPTREWQR